MSETIEIQGDKVLIHQLEFEDPDTASHLRDLETEEDRLKEVKRALRVGIIALRGSKTVELANDF